MPGQPPLFSYSQVLQEADALLQDILRPTCSPDTDTTSEEVRPRESLAPPRAIVKVRVSSQDSCTPLKIISRCEIEEHTQCVSQQQC